MKTQFIGWLILFPSTGEIEMEVNTSHEFTGWKRGQATARISAAYFGETREKLAKKLNSPAVVLLARENAIRWKWALAEPIATAAPRVSEIVYVRDTEKQDNRNAERKAADKLQASLIDPATFIL